MCAAQLAKIVCYDPAYPYLILIPTVLLSMGMFMFFTLGASMVADVCDEDELRRGTRSEGTYYSVYWWFIKMGTAFASLVTGALLVYTSFDERQNVAAEAVRASATGIRAEIGKWQEEQAPTRPLQLDQRLVDLAAKAARIETHLRGRRQAQTAANEHTERLIGHAKSLQAAGEQMRKQIAGPMPDADELKDTADELLRQANRLGVQSPNTLLRLRAVEIGLPLALSTVSILLTLRYPLTEARCYEIKQALEARQVRSDG